MLAVGYQHRHKKAHNATKKEASNNVYTHDDKSRCARLEAEFLKKDSHKSWKMSFAGRRATH